MTHADLPDTEFQASPTGYHAVLLRYWRDDQEVLWRYVVQDLATGEQYTFADMDLLVAFLYQHMESEAQ